MGCVLSPPHLCYKIFTKKLMGEVSALLWMAHLFLQKLMGEVSGRGRHRHGTLGTVWSLWLYTTTIITSSMHSGCVNSLNAVLSLLEMLMSLLLRMLCRVRLGSTHSVTSLLVLFTRARTNTDKVAVHPCIECGVEMVGSHTQRKFCSGKCKARYRKKFPNGKLADGHMCRTCGKLIPLSPGQANKWYCSKECVQQMQSQYGSSTLGDL